MVFGVLAYLLGAAATLVFGRADSDGSPPGSGPTRPTIVLALAGLAASATFIAAQFGGPYAAASAALGAVAGAAWPPGRALAGRRANPIVAAGALAPLLPVEVVAAGLLFLAVGRRRDAAGVGPVLCVAVAGFGWFRGQPAPFLIAAGVVAVLLALNLTGAARQDEPGRRLRAVDDGRQAPVSPGA